MRRTALLSTALCVTGCQALLVFENEPPALVITTEGGAPGDATPTVVGSDGRSVVADGAVDSPGIASDPCDEKGVTFLFCDTFENGSPNPALRGWYVPARTGGNSFVDTTRGKDSSASLAFTNVPYSQNVVSFSRPLNTNRRYAFELDFAFEGALVAPGITFVSIRFGGYMLRLFIDRDMRFAFDEFNYSSGSEIQAYVAYAGVDLASQNWAHLAFQFMITASSGLPSNAALGVNGNPAVAHLVAPTDRNTSNVEFHVGDEDAPNFASTIHVDNVRLYATP